MLFVTEARLNGVSLTATWPSTFKDRNMTYEVMIECNINLADEVTVALTGIGLELVPDSVSLIKGSAPVRMKFTLRVDK
jgi:hypothetical protein